MPEPLGPISESFSPGFTVKLTPFSTRRAPNLFSTPWNETRAGRPGLASDLVSASRDKIASDPATGCRSGGMKGSCSRVGYSAALGMCDWKSRATPLKTSLSAVVSVL
ncbi:hypothetical protein FRZ61_33180 [Hypericibacter adhaerens]|uniref:Uncharacterized protein n=1 Tax=Hypericibacter adhaerens TaxID=2602016 RepID=A0A5J6N4B4_9PROT|nr:hypothetical protein FRZ61_33180 [Hypericibacter adhaerens]